MFHVEQFPQIEFYPAINLRTTRIPGSPSPPIFFPRGALEFDKTEHLMRVIKTKVVINHNLIEIKHRNIFIVGF